MIEDPEGNVYFIYGYCPHISDIDGFLVEEIGSMVFYCISPNDRGNFLIFPEDDWHFYSPD
jgi:hypothetical protein